MEKMNDLKALLKHEIQDLMSAEEQIIEAMPAMIETASNGALKKSLQDHLKVTEQQRERLNEVDRLLQEGEEPGEAEKNGEKKGLLSGLLQKLSSGEKCRGMQGLITEGQKVMKADMSLEVKDAAIIAAAQKIEHYEISGYGTARTFARELGLKEVATLLELTLSEEYQADDKLTALALGGVNERADNGQPKAVAKKGMVKKSSAKSDTKAAPTKAAKASNGVKKAAPKRAAKK